ncbi:PQQ-binding-like beta-propeller repeat protein [Deltaproteobacteria bacterium TL4]
MFKPYKICRFVLAVVFIFWSIGFILAEEDLGINSNGTMHRYDLHRTGVFQGPAPLKGELLWKFKTGGEIHTSPVVADGSVYFGSDDGFFYALNAQTGEILWKFKVGAIIWSSPAVANGIVYFGGGNNQFYALDGKTGKMKWVYKSNRWFGTAPAIYKGIVYFGGGDKFFYALDALSGKLIWKFDMGYFSKVSPAIANNTVFLGVGNGFKGSIYSLNADTGSLNWSFEPEKGVPRTAIVYSDKRLFVIAGPLYAIDTETGKVKWMEGMWGLVDYSPTLYQNLIFLGGGMRGVSARDIASAERKFKLKAEKSTWMSTAVAGNHVYFGNEDQHVYAYDLTNKHLIWKHRMGGRIASDPSIYNGILYVGSDDSFLYAIK